MKTSRIMLVMLLAVSLAASFAHAVETSIAYQGVLRDSQGGAISLLQQTIDFRLYSQASGGDALWGRSIAVLLDEEGLFNIELSDMSGNQLQNTEYTNLVAALKSARNSSLFVGLTVNGSSGEIAPRQKLLMVPFASYATDVDMASGDFNVSGQARLNNAFVSGGLNVSGKSSLATVEVSSNMIVRGSLTVAAPNAITGFGSVPVGGIIMWSGAIVPEGWALCDGSAGTPNLVDRFILGSAPDTINMVGGNAMVSLSVENIPSHSHNYVGDDELNGIEPGCSTKVKSTTNRYDADSEKNGNSNVYMTSAIGGNMPFSIMPPFYRLAFIMRKY